MSEETTAAVRSSSSTGRLMLCLLLIWPIPVLIVISATIGMQNEKQ